MPYAEIQPVVERLRRVTISGQPDGSLALKADAGEQAEVVVGAGGAGHWEPLTNGDPENPEIYFSNGDVLMTFMEAP